MTRLAPCHDGVSWNIDLMTGIVVVDLLHNFDPGYGSGLQSLGVCPTRTVCYTHAPHPDRFRRDQRINSAE